MKKYFINEKHTSTLRKRKKKSTAKTKTMRLIINITKIELL